MYLFFTSIYFYCQYLSEFTINEILSPQKKKKYLFSSFL